MKILILAGGRGTRLWPISRSFKPKQFQKFFGEKSLLQITYERILPLAKDVSDIFISTNNFYFEELKKQLPNFPVKNIILEPAFRDRVAAFLLFFCYLHKKDLEEPVAIFPSDHLIKNKKEFLEALKTGEKFISQHTNAILLFGEKPRFPDVGLGYIKKGKLLTKIGKFKFFKVSCFKEKPNLERAKQFLKSKDSFWNTGIFILIPRLIIELTKEFATNNWKIYQKLKNLHSKRNFKNLLKKEYLKMKVVSFEYSILENYSNNIVLPVDFGWSDIGNWAELKRCLTREGKNYVRGNFLGIDSKNILVEGTTPQLIATCGVKDLIIVATDDVVFVCPKERAQDVRKLVQKIEKKDIRFI